MQDPIPDHTFLICYIECQPHVFYNRKTAFLSFQSDDQFCFHCVNVVLYCWYFGFKITSVYNMQAMTSIIACVEMIQNLTNYNYLS